MKPTVVATTIASVTVHRNGALVARRGTVDAPNPTRSGTETGTGRDDDKGVLVEVRGLPLLFAAETLRIRPERGAVSTFEEVLRLESATAPGPINEDERDKLMLELAGVDDEIASVDLVLDVLLQSRPQAGNGGTLEPKLVDARAWIGVLTASRARAAALATKRRALGSKRRDLEKQLQRLGERGHALVEPNAPRVMRGVQFALECAGAFSLEYFVPAARWVPTYALHLTSSPAGSQGRLVTAALVAQASGEDWSGVRLSVSTADLTRETTLPTLSSWRMGRAQAAPAKGFRPLPSDLPSLFAGYDRGPRRPPLPQAAPLVRLPLSMPSGGRPKLADRDVRHQDESSRAEGGSYDSAEALSFESERTSGDHLSLPQSLAFEQAATDPESDAIHRRRHRQEAQEAQGSEESASRSPPTLFAAAASIATVPGAAPFAAKRRARAASGDAVGGRGGGGHHDDLTREPEALPQRLRTASMRMAGPQESLRGSLLPLDPLARLSWLLEGHDLDGTGRAELKRAVESLRQAQQRMEQAPLPRGTSLLLGTSFQSLMGAPSTTDVPGDGTFYRVEVRVDDAPAHIEHRAVPRASNDVWRLCRLDVTGAPLPPGPLAVYEDGAFKVSARLDMPSAGPAVAARASGTRPLDVNLGVDPDVRVLSRTVHLRQAEKGLMSQTSRIEHDIDIELRSTRADPARVVVHDRLPVPADNVKDVAVAVLEERPPLVRTNRDAAGHELSGAFEWRITLMPGDTQKLVLKYAIDLPAKCELEGGNRRE